MTNIIRAQRVKKKPTAYFFPWPQEHLTLSDATIKPFRDDTYFSHWSFARKNYIVSLGFCSPISTIEIFFVSVARVRKIKPTITDILIANNDKPGVSPIRCEMG